MNKRFVVFGILVLILGVVVAFLAEIGVIITLGYNPFSEAYSLQIQTAVAITFMVVGGILIFIGVNKS
jgi:hypothetical protein